MIGSTPISGSHYLVDVIAGSGVAWIAIFLASRFATDRAHKPTVMRA
jgi:membrane-associated phospholipid phosphatase